MCQNDTLTQRSFLFIKPKLAQNWVNVNGGAVATVQKVNIMADPELDRALRTSTAYIHSSKYVMVHGHNI